MLNSKETTNAKIIYSLVTGVALVILASVDLFLSAKDMLASVIFILALLSLSGINLFAYQKGLKMFGSQKLHLIMVLGWTVLAVFNFIKFFFFVSR